MKGKPKAVLARYVTRASVMATDIAEAVTGVQKAVTASICDFFIGVIDDGEQSVAIDASKTAVEILTNVSTKSAGTYGGWIKRLGAAVQNGKLSRDDLENASWSKILKLAESLNPGRGAPTKGGKDGKDGKDAPTEADAVQMSKGGIVDWAKAQPVKVRLALVAALVQSVIDDKTAAKEVKSALIKPVEALRKLAA
jgi:hypothetical protein